MFGADVVIFEFAGLGLSGIEDFFQTAAEENVGGGGALDAMAAGEFALDVGFEFGGWDTDLFEEIGDEAFVLTEQSKEQMLPINLLMGKGMSDALRFLQRFLRLNCKSIQLHTFRYR